MMYLGIDPSIVETGIALIDENMKVIMTKTIKTKSNMVKGNRLAIIYDGMINTLKEYNMMFGQTLQIGIEDYAWHGNKSYPAILVAMGEAGGVIRMALHNSGYQAYKFSPGTVKMFITGKGRCEKGEMMKRIREMYGQEFTNDNIADAFAISLLTSYFHKIKSFVKINREELLPYQLEALAGIGKTKAKKKAGRENKKRIIRKEEKQGKLL